MTTWHMLHTLSAEWNNYHAVCSDLALRYLHRINGAPRSYNVPFLHWLETHGISPRGWVRANQS